MPGKTPSRADGFYSIEFMTPLGSGGGVVVLRDGQARGGDSMMYYTGTYSQHGDQMAAELHILTHAVYRGATSVFGDIHGAHLSLRGRIIRGRITGVAHAAEVPNVGMTFTLTFLGD